METISHTDLCKVGRPSWAYFSLDTCNTRVESPMSLHSVGQHRKSVEVWPRNRTGQLCWGGARPHPHREYCGHFKVSSSLWEMTLISSAGQKKMFTFFSIVLTVYQQAGLSVGAKILLWRSGNSLNPWGIPVRISSVPTPRESMRRISTVLSCLLTTSS